jgi:hypothetical protein
MVVYIRPSKFFISETHEQIFTAYTEGLPITMAARSKALAVFTRSNTGIVGSNPTQRMDVCVLLFCYVVLCVCSGLATADPPSKDYYRLCID